MKLNIAGLQRNSIVDGPGLRYVVFFQGCRHKCMGCHNPTTHQYGTGENILIEELVQDILSTGVKDVTISGGEPFDQVSGLYCLVKKLKEYNINIWIYSGYTFEELLSGAYINIKVLKCSDVLVDGLYIENQRNINLRFKGSSNQRIIDINKSLESGRVIEKIFEE